MPRVCTVCSHAKRNEIDKALLNDEPNQRIATIYKVTESAVRRHKAAHHVAPRIAKAQAAAETVQAGSLLERLLELNAETRAILQEARVAQDNELALKAVARVEKQIELEGKLLGELNEGTTVNVLVAPEWLTLRSTIVQAVTPYPEAREAVLRALSEPN